MDSTTISFQELLKHIRSTACDFRAVGPVVLDGRVLDPYRQDFRNHPLRTLLESRPDGALVSNQIATGDYTDAQRTELLYAAVEKVLKQSSGVLEIKIGDRSLRKSFLENEIPAILENRAITQVNGMPRAELQALYHADFSPQKLQAVPALLTALRDRKMHKAPTLLDLGVRSKEVKLLEREIRKLVGPKFQDLGTRIRAAERELFHANLTWNARLNEQAALGLWRFNPLVQGRLFFERRWKRTELHVRRDQLDRLLSEQRTFEDDLFKGKYNSLIYGAMLKHGIDFPVRYGTEQKQVLNDALERVIASEKTRQNRELPLHYKQAMSAARLRPRMRM